MSTGRGILLGIWVFVFVFSVLLRTFAQIARAIGVSTLIQV